MAKPWPINPKVQGSNPIEAKKFFHSFQSKRLRDSIDGYCKIGKCLGNTEQEAQTSKSGQLIETSSEPTYLPYGRQY